MSISSTLLLETPVPYGITPSIRRIDSLFVWLVRPHFNGDFMPIKRFITRFRPCYRFIFSTFKK